MNKAASVGGLFNCRIAHQRGGGWVVDHSNDGNRSDRTLGGHSEIGDHVYIGGLSAVHQFARIGSQVIVGGLSGARGDIIPFGLASGQHAMLEGLNVIGMKRRKFTRERLATVRAFYKKLFHGPGIFAERLAAVQGLASEDPAIADILTFIANGKHRPLCLPAATGPD
jgi:UDP-N-acetylglucosamine acyltransferase